MMISSLQTGQEVLVRKLHQPGEGGADLHRHQRQASELHQGRHRPRLPLRKPPLPLFRCRTRLAYPKANWRCSWAWPGPLADPQSEPQRHLSDQLQGRVQVERRSRRVPETGQVPGGHHLHGERWRHQGQRHLLGDLHPVVR